MANIAYSAEELISIKKLISSAGLIKVFDGKDWIDLRKVMALVVDDAIELHAQLEKSENLKEELKAEVFRLSHPAYHD